MSDTDRQPDAALSELKQKLDEVLNLFQADLQSSHMASVCRNFMEKYGWQIQSALRSEPSAPRPDAAPSPAWNQEALDRSSFELQRHFGREGSIYGIKACEEIARIAIVAYGQATPSSPSTPSRDAVIEEAAKALLRHINKTVNTTAIHEMQMALMEIIALKSAAPQDDASQGPEQTGLPRENGGNGPQPAAAAPGDADLVRRLRATFTKVNTRFETVQVAVELIEEVADALERTGTPNSADKIADALQLAIRQNSNDMILTGDELRRCEYALGDYKRTGTPTGDDARDAARWRLFASCAEAEDFDLKKVCAEIAFSHQVPLRVIDKAKTAEELLDASMQRTKGSGG